MVRHLQGLKEATSLRALPEWIWWSLRPSSDPQWEKAGDPERFDLHIVPKHHRRSGPWKLYDEKFIPDVKNAFNSKDQSTWLEDLKDYLSGRTPELDALFT